MACSVQGQHALLLGRLDRHETHVGPGHRFADRLAIGHIVLVRLDVGFDELLGHQLYRVTERLQLPRPVVCAATRFHAHQARWQIVEKRARLIALELLLQHRFASLIQPGHLDHARCQIIPTVVTFILSLFLDVSGHQPSALWHHDAVSGRGTISLVREAPW
jgi:hypothetical protein